MAKPGLFFTLGKTTEELAGARERLVGPDTLLRPVVGVTGVVVVVVAVVVAGATFLGASVVVVVVWFT